MESDKETNAPFQEKEHKNVTWVDLVSIVVLINMGIFILVTILAVIGKSGYLDQFITVGLITGAVFAVDVLLIFIFTLIPPILAKRIFKFSDETQGTWFGILLIISSVIFILGSSTLVYILVLPNYPLLYDPFYLGNANSLLGTIYTIWWYFGFVASIATVTILYILVESGY